MGNLYDDEDNKAQLLAMNDEDQLLAMNEDPTSM